jgi:hypothetical protein
MSISWLPEQDGSNHLAVGGPLVVHRDLTVAHSRPIVGMTRELLLNVQRRFELPVLNLGVLPKNLTAKRDRSRAAWRRCRSNYAKIGSANWMKIAKLHAFYPSDGPFW